MKLLIDEDIPAAVANLFSSIGHAVQRVATTSELRGQPDEVIFDYAVAHDCILVTADLGIPNPLRFPIDHLTGIILIRFPNQMPVQSICEEIKKLIGGVEQEDYHEMMIIEPGFIRIRRKRMLP